ALGFDDHVAEARTWRDVDLDVLDLLAPFLGQQLFVSGESSLALGLAGARRHAHPFELTLERPLTRALGPLFLDQPSLLLVEPRRVVAFPRNARAAVELEDPAGHVVEEVAV